MLQELKKVREDLIERFVVDDKKFYRTTIVVWTDYDPLDVDLNTIISDGYISFQSKRHVPNPYLDPHCDYSEYFDDYNRNS